MSRCCGCGGPTPKGPATVQEEAAWPSPSHTAAAIEAATAGSTPAVSPGSLAPLQRAPSHQQWPRTDLSLRLY